MTEFIARLPKMGEDTATEKVVSPSTMKFSLIPADVPDNDNAVEAILFDVRVPDSAEIDNVASITVADASRILDGVISEMKGSSEEKKAAAIRDLFRQRCLMQLAILTLYPEAVALHGEGIAEDMMKLLSGQAQIFESRAEAAERLQQLVQLISDSSLSSSLLLEME